ncbi:DUF3883 domain-containing protein [Xanthomonas campestris pv. campestris]|uniref:DUF3883 domain-containing protein n=1 Tax=Xanthomonas campestris TaxID=339 RepID=UPI0032E43438
MSIETVCKMLTATYDGAGLDLPSACVLHDLVEPEIVDRQALYRHVIRVIAVKASPSWCALLRTGRDALRAGDPDVLVCFQRAGAFDPEPSPSIVEWWDDLASSAYADLNMDLIATGRQAERLSLDYERRRLALYAGAPEPIWKSLDSNAAGYDIQSWDLHGDHWAPKYIEVKGSKSDMPRLHLTRHEWNTAVRHGATHMFQVWELTRCRMAEISVDEMAAHIPTDNGAGAWKEVVVTLPPLPSGWH